MPRMMCSIRASLSLATKPRSICSSSRVKRSVTLTKLCGQSGWSDESTDRIEDSEPISRA